MPPALTSFVEIASAVDPKPFRESVCPERPFERVTVVLTHGEFKLLRMALQRVELEFAVEIVKAQRAARDARKRAIEHKYRNGVPY